MGFVHKRAEQGRVCFALRGGRCRKKTLQDLSRLMGTWKTGIPVPGEDGLKPAPTRQGGVEPPFRRLTANPQCKERCSPPDPLGTGSGDASNEVDRSKDAGLKPGATL